jgi:hypothetical protein
LANWSILDIGQAQHTGMSGMPGMPVFRVEMSEGRQQKQW